MKEFILKSNVFLAGLKGTSKNGIRKYFTNLGLKFNNIETSNNLEEAISPISDKDFNILFIDDESEDIKNINELIEIFITKYPNKNNRLLALFATNKNQAIVDDFMGQGGDLHIEKPYTMDSFEKTLESYFKDLKKSKKPQQKKSQVLDNRNQKAVSAYQNFKEEFDYQKDEYAEKFQGVCQSFLDSLEGEVDETALTDILNVGLEYKNYEALHLFVKAWIQIFPIQDEDVADVTRVLIYNKNFSLMNSITPKEQNAKVALGAGMIVAAIASEHKKSEKLNETILDLIKKGLELSSFKNNITKRAIELLINLNAIDMAQEIFNYEVVQNNLSQDQVVFDDIKYKLSA